MSARAALLPVVAVVAVSGLLGVQLAAGGADFKPPAVQNPCAEQSLPPATDDLDRVAQSIVFEGVQRAACALGVSREELLLALPEKAERQKLLAAAGRTDDDLATQLEQGFIASVDRLDRGGRLPTAAQVLPKYAEEAGLPGIAVDALRGLSPELVNGYFPVDQILRDSLAQLDVATLLQQVDGADSLEAAVQRVITDAAVKQIQKVVGEQLPPQLKALLGLP